MKNYFLFLFLVSVSLTGCLGQKQIGQEQHLRNEIAQMLMVGFRGTEMNDHILNDILQYNVGGVILFEYDAPSKSRPRNITSPRQLKKLIEDIKSNSSVKLFISIDQEGGKVNRLKSNYGFPEFVSAQYLGNLNNADSTRYWAQKTAQTLAELGFNLNFAPCVDINTNPNCPVIGKIERSFSNNPDIVAKHATIWIDEQKKEHIFSALKHFPGHGSSTTDTHLQFTDITGTWSSIELEPYKILIKQNECDFIMTSHVMNKNLDAENPATLSKSILTGILRDQLKFEGIIISDDMEMGAIKNNYTLSDALEKGINAGVDIFIFSNNGAKYDPEIVPKFIDTVMDLVKTNKVTEKRIHESFTRIIKIKELLPSD